MKKRVITSGLDCSPPGFKLKFKHVTETITTHMLPHLSTESDHINFSYFGRGSPNFSLQLPSRTQFAQMKNKNLSSKINVKNIKKNKFSFLLF